MSDFLLLKLPRIPRGNADRMRIFPGCLGDIVLVKVDPKETIVRITKAKFRAALQRADTRMRREWDTMTEEERTGWERVFAEKMDMAADDAPPTEGITT